MKTSKIIFLFCLKVLLIGKVLSQSDPSIVAKKETLESTIPTLMEKYKVPGIAVSMIENGRSIGHTFYGVADINGQEKITSSTGFNVGSISKVFTAVSILSLVEGGDIDLDSPVEKYLTRWKIPSSTYDHNRVTIRSLLNHTAGISIHGYPGFIDKDSLPSLEESLDGNNGPARENEKAEIIIEPQSQFKYSGGGYTLLQLVIEEVTGGSFESYMQEKIFTPLNMNATTFEITQQVLSSSATPHDENMLPLPMEYFTAKAAAGLHTTLHDFTLFIERLLNKDSVIGPSSIDLMMTPTEVSGNLYGLGVYNFKMGSMVMNGHAGSNTGWQSAFFIDLKTNSGLIMMTNGDVGDKALKQLLRKWASVHFKK